MSPTTPSSSSATTSTTSKSNKSASSAKWLVALVVLFYMSSALTMVFVNKAVLNSAPSLPVTFLIAQLTLSVILLHVSALFSPKVAKDVPKWSQIITLTKEKWRGLWKVVSVNAIGLLFNTLCLRDVDASFFQIARGLVLPLTIVTSAVVIRARPSLQVILAATGVTTGFLIGVAPSLSPFAFRDIPLQAVASDFASRLTASPLSLFYGVLSSLFIALHAVWIKSSLPVVDNSAIALAWWSNFAGLIILFPMAIINGEVPKLIELLGDVHSESARTFLIGSLVTGIVGFFLCISSLISIKVTSPITHMFSSAARSVLQTLLGVMIFSDLLTVNRALSIFVISLGTVYYTWVKSRENSQPKSTSSPSSSSSRASNMKERDLERGKSEDFEEAEFDLGRESTSDESLPMSPITPVTPHGHGGDKRDRDTVIWEAESEDLDDEKAGLMGRKERRD